MPKKTFTVDDFSGGVNSYKPASDLEINELAQCQGFLVERGIVSVLGDMKGAYTIGSGDTNAGSETDIEPGYGLFAFAHDYNTDDVNPYDYPGTIAEKIQLLDGGVNHFILQNRLAADSHNRYNVYDSDKHTWRNDQIDLGGSNSGTRVPYIKPCIVMADGCVRISPGNFRSQITGATIQADSIGDIASDTTAGGLEAINCDNGWFTAIKSGEVITIGKVGSDARGLGMEVVVINSGGDNTIDSDGTSYTSGTQAAAIVLGRNMTGFFPASLDIDTDNDDAHTCLEVKWRGPVIAHYFPNNGTRGLMMDWVSTYACPRPPLKYDASFDMGIAPSSEGFPFMAQCITSGSVVVNGTISPSITLLAKNDLTNVDSLWDGQTISLYMTALYDEVKQESQPRLLKTGVTIAIEDMLALSVVVNYSDAAASQDGKNIQGDSRDARDAYMINPRVTGARVYYEDVTGDPGMLFQLLEIDFIKGVKKADSESFRDWTLGEINNCVLTFASSVGNDIGQFDASGDKGFLFEIPPKTITYETNTGYFPDTVIHARYKTACIANRRLFAGNIMQNGIVHGDRMIASPVNKFDILPESNTIDVTIGDGDEIIKLESYADRVLQFKKRTLYIINVGSGPGGEYLESEHKNMGIENPSQACITEYGVAWINSMGFFLFDGQKISDLSRDKLQLTNTTNRALGLNISGDNIPSIGYHPVKKWVIINSISDGSKASDTEAWIIDLKTGAWMFSNTFTTADDSQTNFVWTADNELINASTNHDTSSASTPNFYKYRNPAIDTPVDELQFLTQEYDLGMPSVKKSLKSIYITYSANASTRIEADIIDKGEAAGAATITALQEHGGSTDYYTEALGFKSTSNRIETARLVPSSKVKKATTFQLRLHNDTAAYPYGANFKLYDISFVYRIHGVK